MPRDYDDDSVRKKDLTGMNKMFAETNIVVLVLFGLCCNGLCLLPLILSVIGVATCTDEKAQSNAKIVLIISGIVVVLGVIGNVGSVLLNK